MAGLFEKATKSFVEVLEKADQQAKAIASERAHRDADSRSEEILPTAVDEKLQSGTLSSLRDIDFDTAIAEIENKKSQFDQAMAQLKAKDTIITQLQQERGKWLTVDSNTKQLEGKTTKLEHEKSQLSHQLAVERAKHGELIATIGNLEGKVAEAHWANEKSNNEILRWESLTKLREQEVSRLQQEFAEHKKRATNILQEKDNQLESLRELLKGDAGGSHHQLPTHHDDDADWEEVKKQYQTKFIELQKELKTTTLQYEAANAEAQAHRIEIEEMRTVYDSKISHLQQEVAYYQGTAESLKGSVGSLQTLYDQEVQANSATRFTAADQLKEKEMKILALEKQLREAQVVDGEGREHTESRFKALADNLVIKQTQLETITYQKEALQLKYDKAIQKQNELEGVTGNSHDTSIYMNSVDTYSAPVPGGSYYHNNFMQSLSRRGNIGNKVASFASGSQLVVDKISLQAGRLLHRSPVFRMGFLMYLVVLHLWVFIIYTTQTSTLPELADSGAASMHQAAAATNAAATTTTVDPTPVPPT